MSRLVWLSYPLGLNDPRPPAIPAPELVPLYTIEVDGSNVQTLRVASHTGTHVDAALHVVEGGVTIYEYSPDEFVFSRPELIELSLADEEVVSPEHLRPWLNQLTSSDIALFKFNVGAIRGSDPERFSLHSPGFGVESARWIKVNCPNLRAVGMDVPSLSCISVLDQTMVAHNELLGGDGCRFLVIEDMNLNQDLTGLREVRLSPWLVTGMDSAPCSVVGVIED